MLSFLIVEDVDEMRLLIQETLTGIPGFSVSGLAKNTWEARTELLRRRPSVVLLDEILPGESSLDLLGEMVNDQLPVLLLTGVDDTGRPVAAGAKGRLRKPTWETLEADRIRLEKQIRAILS